MDPEDIDPDEILKAIEDGGRKALLAQKQAGLSVTIWEDGKMVVIPPEEIEVSPSNV